MLLSRKLGLVAQKNEYILSRKFIPTEFLNRNFLILFRFSALLSWTPAQCPKVPGNTEWGVKPTTRKRRKCILVARKTLHSLWPFLSAIQKAIMRSGQPLVIYYVIRQRRDRRKFWTSESRYSCNEIEKIEHLPLGKISHALTTKRGCVFENFHL